MAVAIDAATQGQVSKGELRPDLFPPAIDAPATRPTPSPSLNPRGNARDPHRRIQLRRAPPTRCGVSPGRPVDILAGRARARATWIRGCAPSFSSGGGAKALIRRGEDEPSVMPAYGRPIPFAVRIMTSRAERLSAAARKGWRTRKRMAIAR